jgi:hypothetical protein
VRGIHVTGDSDMKTTFFLAVMALSIGAAAAPALARGDGSPVGLPNFAAAAGAPQEHAQIASERFAALAMTWIAAENAKQAADQSDG